MNFQPGIAAYYVSSSPNKLMEIKGKAVYQHTDTVYCYCFLILLLDLSLVWIEQMFTQVKEMMMMPRNKKGNEHFRFLKNLKCPRCLLMKKFIM